MIRVKNSRDFVWPVIYFGRCDKSMVFPRILADLIRYSPRFHCNQMWNSWAGSSATIVKLAMSETYSIIPRAMTTSCAR
jgi:hypothetical protein